MQGFNPNKPAYKSDLSSAVIRTQLNAINSAHSGSSPPSNPQVGQSWLNTANGIFSVYHNSNWIEIFRIDGLIAVIDGGTF